MKKIYGAGFAAVLLMFLLVPFFSSASAAEKYYSDSMESSISDFAAEASQDSANKIKYFELASVLKEFGRNKEALDSYKHLKSQLLYFQG